MSDDGRMPTYIALLRGINLGGRNRVAMPALRAVVESLGHSDVRTYIQSGNVLFTAGRTSPRKLAADLEKAVADELDVPASVVVISQQDLARIAEQNPFADEPDPKRVHVFFLQRQTDASLRKRLQAAAEKASAKGRRQDAVRAVGKAVFLHTPEGYGRSDLAAALARANGPLAGTVATARNWATVTKLLHMCR